MTKQHFSVKLITFLLLTNAFLFSQAWAAMNTDTDSQTTSETIHKWNFDDNWKFNDDIYTSPDYGEDVDGESYDQDGAVSASSASQPDDPSTKGYNLK